MMIDIPYTLTSGQGFEQYTPLGQVPQVCPLGCSRPLHRFAGDITHWLWCWINRPEGLLWERASQACKNRSMEGAVQAARWLKA